MAVIPLKPKDKRPLTAHGVKDATTNPGAAAVWWTENPDANVGIATGEPSGFFVMDFDPRNAGEGPEYAELQARCEATGTLSAHTGGGGRHFLFQLPEGKTLRGKVAGITGVDVKGTGGYIVAPPSVHPETGATYRWELGTLWSESGQDHDTPEAVSFWRDIAILPPPDWLLGLVVRTEDETRERKEVDPNDDRPGTRFNREATWAEILEPHGWTALFTEDGETFWCRPGKTEGTSATSNYEGSGYLYVFSTSTEFEANEPYDKFGAWALLNHGGDLTAAGEELAERYRDLPPPPPADGLFNEVGVSGAKAAGSAEQGPAVYTFEPAFDASHWVSRYIDYAAKQTDAALEYHEAAALVLLGMATASVRVNLAPYPGGLKTNLYLLLVGGSTRSRKSTSQAIATDMAKYLHDSAVLPGRTTTEALIQSLAQHSPAPSVWAPDEFGMTIAEIGRRDFLRGIEELLLTIYGGKDYTYQTKADTITVRNPHLSMLAASTPEALALAGPTAMLGGLLPRFGIVFPRTLPPARPADSVDGLAEERTALMKHLRVVWEQTQESPVMRFDGEATRILNGAEADLVDKGVHTARLPAMLFKVAALAAAGRRSSIVQVPDAEAAIRVIYRWKDGAEHLQPYLRQKSADIEFERALNLTLEVLAGLGGKAHRSRVARGIKVPKQRLDQIQATLADRDYIRVDGEGHWSATGV